MAAAKRFRAAGHQVLFPFGDNARFDFAVYKNRKFDRIQAKTARLDEGVAKVDLASTNYKNSESTTNGYDKSEIDYFAVWVPEKEDLLILDVRVFGNSAWLRYREPKKADSNINWAEDYKFRGGSNG